jgi:phosphoribosylformimino-5-aminoimidazole carboxamide ribotide isomerase
MVHVFPAIDLRGGRVVRLLRGDYQQETEYSTDPVAVGRRWVEQGARILHVVDLDGSLKGGFRNLSIVSTLLQGVQAKIHFGGGVRTVADIGVHRVIIGTKFFVDPTFRDEIAKLPASMRQQLIVSIDSRRTEGVAYYVQHTGWTKGTVCTARDALRMVEQTGISLAVVTDILQDGTLQGPNMALLQDMMSAESGVRIIASGGMASIADVAKLLRIGSEKLFGIIIGKALYEGKINLKEAIALCA